MSDIIDVEEPKPLRCDRCEKETVLWDDQGPQVCDDCAFEILGWRKPPLPPVDPDDAA